MSGVGQCTGRGWGRALLIVGAAFSVTSNVVHTMLYPRPDGVGVAAWQALVDQHPEYMPGWWPVAVSALWPVLLFMVIEAMARVAWPGGFWSWSARIGGLLPVGSVAAVVSYTHLSSLLAYHGASRLESAIGPIAIDGAMLMGTVILLLTSPRGQQRQRRSLAVRVAEMRAATVAVREAAAGRDGAAPLAVEGVAVSTAANPAAVSAQQRPQVSAQPVPDVSDTPPTALPDSFPTPEVSTPYRSTSVSGTPGNGRTAVPAATAHPMSTGPVDDAADTDQAWPSLHLVAPDSFPAAEGSAQVDGDETADPEVRMRAYWDREVTAGRVPSGADLSRASGGLISPATGRRRRAAWESELPEQMRANAHASA